MKQKSIHHKSRASVRCGAMLAAMSIAILPTVHSAEPSMPDPKPDNATVAGKEKNPQTYKITPPPAGGPRAGMDQSLNKLTVDQKGDTAIINITSDTGMGKLTIQPQSGKWPEKIRVRLHLKGLEGFSVSNEAITVDRSKLKISAYDKDGKPFTGKYLMEKSGYYEVEVPAKLFTDKTAALTLDWTDFWRH